MRANSMMPKNMLRKSGATRANSTSACPRALRRRAPFPLLLLLVPPVTTNMPYLIQRFWFPHVQCDSPALGSVSPIIVSCPPLVKCSCVISLLPLPDLYAFATQWKPELGYASIASGEDHVLLGNDYAAR